MGTTQSGWEVIDEGAGVLTREYAFAKGATARMMTARCADGSLVAISPASRVSDDVFSDLESFGKVSALIAPNGLHYYGLHEWSEAFPDARLVAPPEAAARIRKKLSGALEFGDVHTLSLAPGTRATAAPGQRIGETWLQAHGDDAGHVWYVSDTCFSMAELPPALVPRLLFKWMKCAPGFRLNRLSLKMFAKDKPTYKKWLLEKLDEQAPSVVITAHGDIVRGSDLADRFRAEIEAAF